MAATDPVLPPPRTEGQQAATFNVGYYGTGPIGQPKPGQMGGGVNTGFGFPPGSPGFAATQGAYQQSQAAREAGLAALLGNRMTGNPAYQSALNRYLNPYGMDPRALQQQMRMAADTEAGSRGNALMRMEQSANAKGFGNSMGLIDAQGRLRAQSAANLNDTQAKLFIQDQIMAMQREGMSADLIGRLLGIDAQTVMAYAQMQGNYAAPVIPGISQGPNGQPLAQGGWQGPAGTQPMYGGQPIQMGGMVQWA
jgi:hypothetical protein